MLLVAYKYVITEHAAQAVGILSSQWRRQIKVQKLIDQEIPFK